MYSKESLAQYPFFKAVENENYIDSLVHTVDKDFILLYVKNLIENNKPFGVVKLDVDNFKLVNDNYGHHIGDIILSKLGEVMIEGVGDSGIVGHVGGDEFLVIFFGEQTYDSIWAKVKNLFDNYLRKPIDIASALNFKVTLTAGVATFPNDAKDYDELFICVEKALFRGKSKGRNCFIVYVDEKHKNIDLKRNVETVCDDIAEIHRIFTKNEDKNKKILKAFEYFLGSLSLNNAYYLSSTGQIIIAAGDSSHDLETFNPKLFEPFIGSNGLLVCNNYSDYKETVPFLHEFCWKSKIYSFVLSEVDYGSKRIGYVLFVDKKLKRIWQEKDKAIISFIAKSISYQEK